MRKHKTLVLIKQEINLRSNVFSYHIQTLKTKFMFLTVILNFNKKGEK